AKDPQDRYSDPGDVAAALAPFAEGNKLAKLVRDTLADPSRLDAHHVSRSETRIAKSAESDTYAGLPRSWSAQTADADQVRLKRVRMAFAGLTIAAVVSIGWLAVLATAKHESVREATEARQNALQVAAQYANSEIVKEISRRFGILSDLASDDEL